MKPWIGFCCGHRAPARASATRKQRTWGNGEGESEGENDSEMNTTVIVTVTGTVTVSGDVSLSQLRFSSTGVEIGSTRSELSRGM